jgi:hypothetical protein
MNGKWSQLDVTPLDVTPLGARSATASLALTGFWAAATAGRVPLVAIARWLPRRTDRTSTNLIARCLLGPNGEWCSVPGPHRVRDDHDLPRSGDDHGLGPGDGLEGFLLGWNAEQEFCDSARQTLTFKAP